jgi:hypothetical protein
MRKNLIEKVAELEADKARLMSQIFDLEKRLGYSDEAPPALHLTLSEERLFLLLMRNQSVSHHDAFELLYSRSPRKPTPKVISVFMCHIRRKLRVFDFFLNFPTCSRWAISPAEKERIRKRFPTLQLPLPLPITSILPPSAEAGAP